MDRHLIELLRANGRASYAELARRVGLSSPAVHERVGKPEASGVITGYRAVIEPASLGRDVTALVGVIESACGGHPGSRGHRRRVEPDQGRARTGTTVVLSTKWEGRHG